MEVKDIISKLTIEEKAALLSGKNEWESRDKMCIRDRCKSDDSQESYDKRKTDKQWLL